MSEDLNLEELFFACKEKALHHRYITKNHIEPLLEKLNTDFNVEVIGRSVNKQQIYSVKVGNGAKKILMWSQMHGNESTTTKALFDLFKCFETIKGKHILNACTFYIIPILNPDGSQAYTRVNANNVDLNRDAQDLSQPESKILSKAFNDFKPDFCFNLHGQRTIFSAGNTNNSATVSFLAPAQDIKCTVTDNRKKAMEIIANMNAMLQSYMPKQVGIYDDAFNINCVGDTFQSKNVPTILFEAGHYANDYSRETVRKYIFMSMLVALDIIANKNDLGQNHSSYFDIPKNEKLFYDIIIREAKIIEENKEVVADIGVQFEEVLVDNKIYFSPKIKDFGDLAQFYAHKTIEAHKQHVILGNKARLKIGNAIDFVMMNNKLFSLKSINN